MRGELKKLIFRLFAFIFILSTALISFEPEILYASEIDNSNFIKKVSKSYTNKFCNAIGFGLSKESAMDFSFEENNKVFKNRKEMKNLNKELLSEEIAISVVEQCGYPIQLSGDIGVLEFKAYYLSKYNEPSTTKNR